MAVEVEFVNGFFNAIKDNIASKIDDGFSVLAMTETKTGEILVLLVKE
jgi:hypothetical protein